MQSAPIIRDDLSECSDLFVKVFNRPPWDENWTVSTALARLTEIVGTPGFEGLKAISDGRIIGFALGYAESFDGGGDFYLKEMCVLPDVQRKGIGTAILEELKAHLLRIGARKLYLLTERGGRAENFYEKNGFYTSETMIMVGCWLTPKNSTGE